MLCLLLYSSRKCSHICVLHVTPADALHHTNDKKVTYAYIHMCISCARVLCTALFYEGLFSGAYYIIMTIMNWIQFRTSCATHFL